MEFNYNTACDYARASGLHPSTVACWIRSGKIKGYKPKKSKFWRIALVEFSRVKPKKDKSNKYWSKTEVYILKNNLHLSNEVLTKMIKRSVGAIKIKRHRLITSVHA